MRGILLIILLGVFFPVLGQDNELRYTGTFDNTLAKEVVLDIEKVTGTKFFFQEHWLDSLDFSGNFLDTPLQDVLKQVLDGSSFSFVIRGNDVILTDNVVIIEEPKIASSFDGQEQLVDETTALGLVFSREYQNKDVAADDFENYVFDIGKRSDMVIGGESTLVGYVKNKEDNEPVAGALVYIQEPFKAATTDYNGFYTLTLPNGQHNLIYQYAGMKPTKRNIVLFSDGSLSVDMLVDVIALQEVVIESDKDVNIKDVNIGVNKIDVEESKTVPLVLGEKDILKIATTTAGVQTAGEGASGFNVRGGKTDQNLILLNGATIYNPSHFFGFFSAFNSEAVKSMEIYKGSIPVKYGGRLSSVFDVAGKKGNTEKFSGSGGISPVTAHLTLEVPIIKDTTSVLVSGRTTYSDWLLNQIDNINFSSKEFYLCLWLL